MRIAAAAALAAVAALLGCASSDGRTNATWAELRISYFAQGRSDGLPQRWTLRCGPAGGTLPRRAAACRRLRSLERPLAPVPKDLFCTEVYGGPGEVVVSGRLRDRRVWALFTRRDGCQIARWNEHSFLWGGRSGAAP